jgi:hypothetical protein
VRPTCEPWVAPLAVAQPTVSSLQPTCVPVHDASRTKSTVSYSVPAPQVSMVAVPEADGVQLKTVSGAVPPPQVPARPLLPAVVPVTTPPSAGITVGEAQGSVKLAV